ncbi:MAG: DUF5752 family protein [Chloroflexota bacterium]
MTQWLADNWLKLAWPALAFLATYVVGLWLRGKIDVAFERWTARTRWAGGEIVSATARRPFVYWFVLLGAYMAIHVSTLSAVAKMVAGNVMGSLLVLSLVWVVICVSERLLRLYMPRVKVPQRAISLVVNAVKVVVAIVGLLTVLDIWGLPTSALLLLIAVVVLVVALALRATAPNVFAGFQLSATQQIRVADYVKLETGEEGYVTAMTWNSTHIRAPDESAVIVPNSRLLQHTVINYGRPLKKANEPFRFRSRAVLTELTGLKAGNARELTEVLKRVPDAVVYHHTHHFLEEHDYLAPVPSNDFAVWVSGALGDEVLGERLASVDTFEFASLGGLRERLVAVMEEHLSKNPSLREAMAGREFHFLKDVSAILPTHWVAHDLREFVEALRKISLSALFFHMFESRLRLGRGLNDFSIWLKDSLGEAELGDEVAHIDPYTHTLEGLRSKLIQLIEKRIK